MRNMVRQVAGDDDSFLSYETSHYKLHYYETPTNLKFVMLTDTKSANMSLVLQQIYMTLYVEYGMLSQSVSNVLGMPTRPCRSHQLQSSRTLSRLPNTPAVLA